MSVGKLTMLCQLGIYHSSLSGSIPTKLYLATYLMYIFAK